MKQAQHYRVLDEKVIQCRLCPQFCQIPIGDTGLCKTRSNRNGLLEITNYGEVCSMNIDPIEKKPLYHFKPGTEILSIGNNGCNLNCAFCQNWQISQTETPTQFLAPEDLCRISKDRNLSTVAFTYAEPTIWFEYIMESAALLQSEGIDTVLVTNGMINPDPLRELIPLISAMNIDIKSMTDEFYKNFCNGRLKPVLDTARTAAASCHVEITNLIVTDLNDSNEEFEALGKFISTELGPQTALHLSRYHPAYRMKKPPTPTETLYRACDITSKYLQYVYLGNIRDHKTSATRCPNCHSELITRDGFTVLHRRLKPDGSCPQCGFNTGIILQV